MKLKMRLLILSGSLGLVTVLPSCQSTGTTTAGTDAVMLKAEAEQPAELLFVTVTAKLLLVP